MEVSMLSNELSSFHTNANDTLANRARWIGAQLKAFERRVKLFGGDSASFEVECKELYGVTPPVFDSAHFQKNLTGAERHSARERPRECQVAKAGKTFRDSSRKT